jgi:hypothetical protein
MAVKIRIVVFWSMRLCNVVFYLFLHFSVVYLSMMSKAQII